ncbi:uncharacterized protein LOC126747584 isoform X2 [Anthonomus grandis grandis]|uniref:uncharacterized protein LOC126747584 isoform X2 n=1 Tax=Anthonomus grandis grandis TaxID=2921223 RepID=UPI0021651EB1|nr:uncharacterized protein LOC126747584 isoform X2 [Anthonomus grandis grandis]
MCQKTFKMGATAGRTLVVLLALFIFAEGAAGSCLSYGHACWGAHGKRGSVAPSNNDEADDDSGVPRWFLSRLTTGPLMTDSRLSRIPDTEEANDFVKKGSEWEQQLREYLRNVNRPSSGELQPEGPSPRFLEKRSTR